MPSGSFALPRIPFGLLNMKNTLATTIGITAAALLTPSAAHAVSSVILQPVSVSFLNLSSTSSGNVEPAPITNMIDQSGLKSGYISEVTNFNGVTEITHKRNGSAWVGATDRGSLGYGYLTFDLGGLHMIQGMALWNVSTTLAIRHFGFHVDEDNDVNNGSVIIPPTVFVASRSESGKRITPQTFSFDPVETQFVHLYISRTHLESGEGPPAIAEIAFESLVTPIDFELDPPSSIRVPFEFGLIPGIIGIVAAGGINYFRNKKDSDQ